MHSESIVSTIESAIIANYMMNGVIVMFNGSSSVNDDLSDK